MESQRLRAFRRPVIDAEFSTFEEKPRGRNPATGARDHTRAQQPCTGADLAFKFRLQPCGQPVDAVLSGDPGRIEVEFLPPIEPGLSRRDFMERLETAIETRMAELDAPYLTETAAG